MKHISNLNDYKTSVNKSISEKHEFWAEIAETFLWKKKWDNVFTGDFKNVDFKWFEGGQLNIVENCLDLHLENNSNKTALIFEPNDPDETCLSYTYSELYKSVNKAANILKKLNVKKGDRVCLYMGMVPELLISVLACARIGAIHSVVFGGFSAKALSDRINDSQCSLLITNDASFRGKKTVPLKDIADQALTQTPSIKNVLVHKRVGLNIEIKNGRDYWWHDLFNEASDDCPAEAMESEDPLFILYTSGSTGKPKGVVHSTAGYMTWSAYTFKNVFQCGKDDTYWCSADIGWITGHSYLTYGPLLNGATTVMFEGVPTWPNAGRFWNIIDKHKVSHFYTAPTAIRSLMACDPKLLESANLKTLKVLGTVGEPINEEAWHWYNEKIGKNKCPIVDTWWQTETGGIMISPLAYIHDTKPCYASYPLPGVVPCLVDSKGNVVEGNDVSGNLCISQSWPGQARSLWGDHKRFKETYFSIYPGFYFTGDGAYRDKEGRYRINGRVDDVMNVSGHRLGTAEIEDAIDLLENVIETAVVGYPHEIKGQGIYAYIICHKIPKDLNIFKKEVDQKVAEIIGPIAKPDKIQIVLGLPKTRSGKIMRRILRKIAEGKHNELGDTSTLLDPSVVEKIISNIIIYI